MLIAMAWRSFSEIIIIIFTHILIDSFVMHGIGMLCANRVAPCVAWRSHPPLLGVRPRYQSTAIKRYNIYDRRVIANASTQKRRSSSKNRPKTPDMPTVRGFICLHFHLSGDADVYTIYVQPKEYQQTLQKSFTIGGIGFHTGDYAFVKVKPAFAGDGRYFVRVPKGTNANDYSPEKPEFVTREQLDVRRGADDGLQPEERAQYFLKFLEKQDEEGYEGDFGGTLMCIG